MSEAKGSWSNTPPWTADSKQDMTAVFTGGRRNLPLFLVYYSQE